MFFLFLIKVIHAVSGHMLHYEPGDGLCAEMVLDCSRRFFDEISQDTGKFVFGVADTLQCLDMGAVETLIVWENLDVGISFKLLFVSHALAHKVIQRPSHFQHVG